MQVRVLDYVRLELDLRTQIVISVLHTLVFQMAHVVVVHSSGPGCNVMSTKACETLYAIHAQVRQLETVLSEQHMRLKMPLGCVSVILITAASHA